MTTIHLDTSIDSETPSGGSQHFDKQRYREQIAQIIPPTLKRFDQVVKRYVLFNVVFAAIGAIELTALTLFFATIARSSTLAISLALLFLTVFSYFMLRLYLLSRRADQLLDIRDHFLNECKTLLNYQEGIAQHHMALAQASCRMATAFHDREYQYYKPPEWADFLSPTMELFSCFWHWQDLHVIKESLLFASIEEHIKLVKCAPTNLEVHAALANGYVMLSSLYADPRKAEGYDEDRWIPKPRYAKAMQDNFKATAERAIEEFKILNEYAPNDPWVHAQLAYSYHDLQMPDEEIKQYEHILKLNPDDKETLFKLGVLYFQEGHNADGLRVYEELKLNNYRKAENLIKFYGAF